MGIFESFPSFNRQRSAKESSDKQDNGYQRSASMFPERQDASQQGNSQNGNRTSFAGKKNSKSFTCPKSLDIQVRFLLELLDCSTTSVLEDRMWLVLEGDRSRAHGRCAPSYVLESRRHPVNILTLFHGLCSTVVRNEVRMTRRVAFLRANCTPTLESACRQLCAIGTGATRSDASFG